MSKQARFAGAAATAALILGLAATSAVANPNAYNPWMELRHELCEFGALLAVAGGVPSMPPGLLPLLGWLGRTLMDLACG